MKKTTIISRDELIKLLKFGKIYLSINYVIDEKYSDEKLKNFFKILPYDDDFGFLIVSFTHEEESFFDIKTLITLNIKDILDIYCLTHQALEFYKTKFDPMIKFKIYPNQPVIEEINRNKIIEDKKNGIKILFELFKFYISESNDFLDEIYIKELLSYHENGYLKQKFKDFYYDLFCYERRNSFFQEDIGFLCDLRAILMLKNRQDIEIFLSGDLSGLIRDQDKNKRNEKIFDLVIETIKTSNLSEDSEKKYNFIAGSIFLKSKQLLNTENKEDNYWQNFVALIEKFKSSFPEETKKALFYLGVFLGYKYLYEDYYKHLKLNIYQDISDNISNSLSSCNNDENLESKNTIADTEPEKENYDDEESTSMKKISKSIDLGILHIDSLIDIYYRKDTKKRKVKDLKQQYTNENKDKLIDLIIQDNYLFEEV